METGSDVVIQEERETQGLWYRWTAPVCILVCVLIFYWIPLFSRSASIQGDTADVHLPLLKYFADRLFSGHLPYWSPYLFSGYPVLANPLMGAWYPLNWPLLLIGVTPVTLQIQLAVHAAIACLGTYYFVLSRLVERRSAAIAGALAFGLSGFFAANSSQLAVFLTAAWFPWLLYSYLRATEGQKLRFTAIGALVGGLIILCGHTQTACLCFVGLLLYGVAHTAGKRVPAARNAGIILTIILGSVAVSAVQSLPAWELARVAGEPDTAALTSGNGVLHPAALMTALLPDWTHTISNRTPDLDNRGYFYAGLLLLPIALIGVKAGSQRLAALLLIVPTLWFMLGPGGGLYRVGVIFPGVQSGPPVGAWFLAAFGLAILFAAGCNWIFHLGRRFAFLGILAAGLLFGDLLYWNSVANPLAYARKSYVELYGRPEGVMRHVVAAPQLPLSRFDSPNALRGGGPILCPLDLKLEATYGYLLRESTYYREYRYALAQNPRLRDGLNASRFLSTQAKGIDINPSFLPRVYFPRTVRDAGSDEESRLALGNLDPAEQAVVTAPHEAIEQDANAGAIVSSFDEQFYRVHYTAQSASLLRLSVPWYPGWQATIASRRIPIVRVDHALMGVIVPPGEHDVEWTYTSRFFYTGAVISVFSALVLLALSSGSSFSRRMDRLLFRGSGYRRRRRTTRSASI